MNVEMQTVTASEEIRVDKEMLAAVGIHEGDEAAISVDEDGIHIAPREIFESGDAFFGALEAELDSL